MRVISSGVVARGALVVFVGTIPAAGCSGGGGNGGGSGGQSLNGQWFGPVEGSESGPGEVVVNFSQNSPLSGTWESRFDDPSFNNEGTLSGTVEGNQIDVFLDSSDPGACDLEASGTRSGDQITGTFGTTPDCSVAETGTFDIDRQASLTGRWSGQVQDDFAGPGTVVVNFSQSSGTGSLSGTFESMFDDPSFDNQGSVSGEVSGNVVNILLDSSDPAACDFNASGARQGDNGITGAYETTETCSESSGGTFGVTRD